jgi:hypothetical protein
MRSRAFKNGDRDGRFLNAAQAAAIFDKGDARAFDLTSAGLAAQLRHQFENLTEARGADGMAFRFKAP